MECESGIGKRGANCLRIAPLMPNPIEPPPSDESPGVPGFRTWRGVYLFVFGCFLFVVFLLAIFSRVYA